MSQLKFYPCFRLGFEETRPRADDDHCPCVYGSAPNDLLVPDQPMVTTYYFSSLLTVSLKSYLKICTNLWTYVRFCFSISFI